MEITKENILRNPRTTFPPTTLIELFYYHLNKDHETIVLVDVNQNQELTKKDIFQRSLILAEYLKKNFNLKTGDTVGVICKNRWEFVIAIVACIFLKCSFAPLNPKYTKYEFKHALELLHPSLIICESEIIEKIKSTGIDIKIFLSITRHRTYPSIQNIIQKENTPLKIIEENIEASLERVCCILFSSGTTGLPKGVMISNKNLVYSLMTRLSKNTFNEITSLSVIPFFHSYGLNIIFDSVIIKQKLIFLSKFIPRTYLNSIEKYKVQGLRAVPSIINFLISSPLVSKYDLSSLMVIASGGAPLNHETQQTLSEKFNVVTVQGYGLTEATFSVTYPDANPIGSVGKLLYNMECKVVDVETGANLGPNQKGEFHFRGPLILKGYLKDQQATNDLFDKDGFMRTGDIGYYDTEGYLYIVDRIKELIKYKGFQVAPAELEGILLKHPNIVDAAVVGKPDPKAGEVPVAFVVVQKSTSPTPDQIMKFVAEHVSSDKLLRGGVHFILEIPRNDAGKILRRKLKEKFKDKSKL